MGGMMIILQNMI